MDTKTPTKEIVPRIGTASISEPTVAFDWKHCWYPVAFIQDLPHDRPYGFSLYGEPLVLFQDAQGRLACLSDRCCHRAAKLSDGQLVNGYLECLYHGWRYEIHGQCVHIPQLPAETPIPHIARVRSFVVAERQGIIWIWLGELDYCKTKLERSF